MNAQAIIKAQAVGGVVRNIRSLQRACGGCIHSQSCLPGNLTSAGRAYVDGLVRHPRTLRRGEHLYWPGANFESVYVLRSGAVKTYILDPSGIEQITGFYGPGDWVGLDAFGAAANPSAAIALADTALCAIAFVELDKLCASESDLRQHLWRRLSQVIQDSQAHALLLTEKPAEQRLASFLVQLSDRQRTAGLTAGDIELSMGRADIANFLGMATETVSRWFTRLQQLNVIFANGRHVLIRDCAALRHIATGLGTGCSH
ncbi:MAG TPA: helix-turn-helix domain-containing protein [Gammaproteobacteria bacterium]|nr:helix-turn-helix domain-containing protein [Gammaproteobacteria bacterium]